ncbi:MAG: o-succinylbenzoate synthase [Gemmatimonadetes bacterium]|nr:o-succinylbenzoate synthase [Gemmatimonadota bacterium]
MRVFSIPMRTRFRRVERREGVLLEGPAGWGEFSPFVEYPPPVAARWLAAAKEATLVAWPEPIRSRIPVNVTVPAVDAQRAHALVRASGCSTAKVKVAEPGQGEQEDIERVEAVRDALGPSGRIRIDANAAWDVDEAARIISALNQFELEYVEQPCADLDQMARLRRRIDVPLAADESVRLAADPAAVAARKAADLIVLKVQPLGGVWPALRVAEQVGLPAVVSSALETSIGMAAGVALAAALPELPYACGLATATMLEGDVVADPLVPTNGYLPVRRPAVDAAALARYEMTGAPAQHWLQRLADAEAAA